MKSINPNKAKNLETIFPILAIDAETDMIVSKNADLTMAFSMKVPEIFAISDGEYDALHEVLVRAIKILPIGYMVHKQDLFIEDEYSPNFESEYLQSNNSVAWENERHFSERPYLRHRCYLYITRPASSPLKRTGQQSSFLKRHLVPKEVQDPKTWMEFMDVVNQFEATFNRNGEP